MEKTIDNTVYIDGDPLPNSYNNVVIDPNWCDTSSVISPNLTLKNAIINNGRMHAVAIIRTKANLSVVAAMQLVEVNWRNWQTIFC